MPDRLPVRIVHHLPGRTRLAWSGLLFNHAGAQRLARHLSGREGIDRVRADARTGRLLVHHDRSVSATGILEAVQNALEVVARLEGEKSPSPALPAAPEPEDRPLVRHFSRVGGVGGLILYLLFRRRVKGPLALASSPLIFHLTAATALAAGYPNFKNGLRYLTGRRSGAHDLLIGVFTLILLFLGEGFLGLGVIWLVNLTDMVQALLWQKARSICPLPAGGRPPGAPDHLTEAARAYAERAAAWALGAGTVAGLAARDFRRALAVLLAANPSAAGLTGPAALTMAAARAQRFGVVAVNRRAVAALARADVLMSGRPGRFPDPGGRLAAAGLPPAPARAGDPAARVQERTAQGARVAFVGFTRQDVPAMQKAYLALCPSAAPVELRGAAAMYLPGEESDPLVRARLTARAGVRQAGRALALVRLANLIGLALAAAGALSPAQGSLLSHLTSLGAMAVAMHPPLSARR